MKYLLALSFILQSSAFAEFGGVTNYSIGMVNVSVTENQSTLEQTDTEVEASESAEASASAVSVISFNFNYEYFTSKKRSYFLKATAPLMQSDGSGLFLGGVGFNSYFSDYGTSYKSNVNGVNIEIVPKMRYWWGASAGGGYLIYNTESAKKSDALLDLSVHAGGGYTISKNWALRGEAVVGKGMGVATSTMNMRVFFGLNRFL